MQSTESAPSAAATASSTGVSGLKATPTPSPSERAWRSRRAGRRMLRRGRSRCPHPLRRTASKCRSGSRDHQMAVEHRPPAVHQWRDRGEDDRADRDLGDEVAVPGVEVEDPRARLDQRAELLTETREVRRVDRRLDLDRACPVAPSHRSAHGNRRPRPLGLLRRERRHRAREAAGRRGSRRAGRERDGGRPRHGIDRRVLPSLRLPPATSTSRCVATSPATETAALALGLHARAVRTRRRPRELSTSRSTAPTRSRPAAGS